VHSVDIHGESLVQCGDREIEHRKRLAGTAGLENRIYG
jgi:hypothetical protein